jgi:small-conductance mechanosensitive channel
VLSKNITFKWALLFGFALIAGRFALAQQQGSEPQPGESEPSAIVPFSPSEILPETEATRLFIRQSEQLAESGLPTENLAAQVEDLRTRYEQLKSRTERRLEGLVPPGLIVDLRSAWEAEKASAKSSQRTPARRSESLASIMEDVRSLRQRWQLTREGAAEAGLPDPVVAEVNKTIAALNALQKTLQDRWVEVISLQDDYSQLMVSYDHMIGLIEERAEYTRARLLSRDSPPIWAVLAASDEELPSIQGAVETWRISLISTVDYIRTYPERLVIQSVLFVILLLLMWAVRKRAREWSDDPSLKIQRAILERPFSQALLITLMSGIIIHPLAPRAFGTLVSCLVLIPLIRLVPGLILPAYRGAFYLLGVLFIVHQLSQLTLSGTSTNRILVALSAILGLVTCGLFLRRSRGVRNEGSWLSHIVFPALKLAIWIFILAAILNVVGVVLLANLLASGLLYSAYLAVVFLIVVVITKGWVQVILRTPVVQRLHILGDHSDLILQRVSRGLTLVSLVLWAWFTLRAFWLDKPFSTAVGKVLTASAKLGTIEISLGFILIFAFLIWLSFAVSKFIRFVLKEDVYTRVKLPRGVPGAISTITHYVILFLGFLIALGAAGFDLSRFTLLAGAFGVGIGFGLQNVVNNFVSGLILLFERPIQVGDKIQMGELFGEVQHIGIRASVVKTWEGAEVIVPNGNLISMEVVNWTLTDQIRRVDVLVGVKYGTDPERVLELLMGVAEKHENVLSDPAPAALFLGFGDSSLDFSLRAWTAFEHYRTVRSGLNVEVNRTLAEAGIEIPFPQRDLHVRSVGSDVKEIVSPERLNRPSDKAEDSEN